MADEDLHLTTKTESGTMWPEVAVVVVRDWATEGLGVSEDAAFYMVWFAYILGGWKALVSSTEADGRYYEVTFNVEKEEMYIDTYKKTHNQVLKREVKEDGN